jgi:hypothetical protein
MAIFQIDRILLKILETARINLRLQLVQVAEIRVTNSLLRRLLHERESQPVTGFTFEEMTMLPFAPGSSPVITITPQPPGVLLTEAPPVTVSSDPVNYPVSVDPTGLLATINIPATATVGAPPVTLTTSYTNADGRVASSTSQPFGPIVAAVTDVTGFLFAQST